MKCKKCNQEMRFGQEACGTDINGNPIFKDFAYCDNCRIRVEIQQIMDFRVPGFKISIMFQRKRNMDAYGLL